MAMSCARQSSRRADRSGRFRGGVLGRRGTSVLTGVDYLHSVGAYFARRVPATAAPMPRLVAVWLENEVHAQSIAPYWPAARATGTPPTLINGLRLTVIPPTCGMLLPSKAIVMTPVLASAATLVTYLVGSQPLFQAVAAALTPAMSLASKPSPIAILAEDARPRPSITFERTV